jgi:hypothetical protein
MSLKALDAVCLRGIVGRERVSFEFEGGIYSGTCGARDTMRELVEGGYVDDQEFAILVPLEHLAAAPRKPSEKDRIAVCVDGDGIPCAVEDAVDARVQCTIQKVGRALAGLTFTLSTVQRG